MRPFLLLTVTSAFLLTQVGPGTDDDTPAVADPVDASFRDTVRPFLETHCIRCHGGEDPSGDMNLDAFMTANAVAADFARWEMVLDQLDVGSMPPAKVKTNRPTAAEVEAVSSWSAAILKRESAKNAGDPGMVPVRRLSNAEYDHTIRDLTGVDIRPTKEFPVDPANEAGFDNSAESLAMSPALVKKYLDAARRVTDYLVLKPDGLAFAPHPVIADTDRDKYGVNNIIDFYGRYSIDYADYFFAAWQYKYRDALGKPDATLESLAAGSKLSPRYLQTIWTLVNGSNKRGTGTSEDLGARPLLLDATREGDVTIGPIAALRAMWNEIPGPDGRETASAEASCRKIRDLVVDLRKQLTPEVKNLPARGISNGSQPLVLWKNRQYVANRMKYSGGANDLKVRDDHPERAIAKALTPPENAEDLAKFEESFVPFCRLFPDAFLVSERARVYLDDKDKGNKGRLLSAGFHSMTGYFRDDGPLYELMLDENEQRELDRLWREFDFITGAPMRQYASYLWYERAETGFIRGAPEFDFVRAEDKDAGSEEKIKRFSEVYLARARRIKAGDEAIQAVADQFAIISASIRQVENDRIAAEPKHIAALLEIAEKAYRRPLSPEERDDIAAFYHVLRDEDELSHEDAVRDTVVGILMSPHFCYRVDLAGEGTGERALSPYDLASRLSYFLWASMPDQELLDHAASGDLAQTEVLVAQARRMLKDDRVRGMATEFGGNWLDFRRFEEHNSVDRARFPQFDDALRQAMFEEPVRFLVDLIQNDRRVHELLDGNHTFVNAPLAKHYGMPAPSDGWVRIDDATPYGRGGLMPMAVFLTKNAPGLRTSPVKRGYWVVKRLLGENIPPPPPNVPDLPDDESKLELSLRETLARHRADVSCMGCHERFDAIGLAFEGFGPVGEARTLDLGGREVDVHATFPGGVEGSGVEGLRAYIQAERGDEFVDNLCRKMLSYALGRSPIPSDEDTITTMKTRLSAENGRFGSLVETIVASRQFRNKRLEAISAHAE